MSDVMYLGLDLSLTSSGVALIDGKGKVQYIGRVNSKPQGDRPIDELNRLLTIRNTIQQRIWEAGPTSVPMACIEGLAFLAKSTSLAQLGALNYLMREALTKMNIPFLIVAPSTLKKHLTGVGRGEKDMMLLEVYKKYDVSLTSDDEADALSLSHIARQFCWPKTHEKLPQYQQEVLNLLKKQV